MRLANLVKMAAALALMGAAIQASASPITLTFEGVGDQASVNNFYNGGTDSAGNSGTNYGINFSTSSLGLIDSDAGGSGNFANEPSASTILFFTSGAAATMNVAAGFDTGFSFYYAAFSSGFVNVYDGLNGTGNVLATINLAALPNNCSGDPTGGACLWTPIGVAFAGIAHSVDFGGTVNQIGFDNITLGAADPAGIPEPGSMALLGLGLAAMAARRRKQA